jgi:hypothetical protein
LPADEKLSVLNGQPSLQRFAGQPYIAVRDRTARTMLDLKLRTGSLWR